MLMRNMLVACLFYCSITCKILNTARPELVEGNVQSITQPKKRDPFCCAHKHGAFHVAQVAPVTKDDVEKVQADSTWQIIKQNGSEVIMQDPQGHIRKISLASSN